MSKKVTVALPPILDLGGSYVFEWDAVDPATGASVSGVAVSDTSLLVVGNLGDGAGQPILVPAPLLAHEPESA